MVLLPYIPLWQRLVIAAQQGVAAEDVLFRFFVNPAGYLFSIPGQQIGEVVFVPPAGSEGGGDGEFPSAPAPAGPRPSALKAEYGGPPDSERPTWTANPFDDPRVRYLAKGGRLLLPFWEFVPYNDADLSARADAAFRAAAAPLIQKLVRPSRGSPAVALKKLRSLYDKTFGKTSSRRNQISLFLYSGPLDHSSRADVDGWDPRFEPGVWERFAQLSTGDGMLETPERLTAMIRHYGSSTRMTKMGIFQVMHHGAKSSWHPGVAERLCPVASIISSEPSDKRYRHPHAEVLRDFWSHGAVQVDSVERMRMDLDIYI